MIYFRQLADDEPGAYNKGPLDDVPDNAVWGVDPREPGVQEGGPMLVPVELGSTELDALAAAIGYGIELQEVCDILDLAVEGRSGLSEFKQGLYDKAKTEIVDCET